MQNHDKVLPAYGNGEPLPLPRRSPKKSGNSRVEKCVATTGRVVTRSESPTPVRYPALSRMPMDSSPRIGRLSSSSSQVSFWPGDEELEDLVREHGKELDELEEQEVEHMAETQPSTESSTAVISAISRQGSGYSGTSIFSQVSVVSTAATSIPSAPVSPTKRRKRCESFEEDTTSIVKGLFEVEIKALTVENTASPSVEADDVEKFFGKELLSRSSPNARARKQTRLIKPTEISGGKIIAPDISTITSVGKLYSCQTKTSASTLKSVEQATTLVNNRNCVYTATTETPSLRKPRLTKACHEPIFLAHNREVQALMDGHNIARGVQVELARGVTQGWWGWNDITPTVLEQLRGSNAEVANKISTIIGKESRLYSPSAVATRKEIFMDLDREHAALLENKGRGLGLMGPWMGSEKESWYGGCVQLSARLVFGKEGNPYTTYINPLRFGKSNRATRYLTSLGIISLKVDTSNLDGSEDVTELLGRRFVLLGRCYLPFYTKEGKLMLVESNEDYERSPVPVFGDNYRISYNAFVRWHNPQKYNKNQPMNKWLARWALILSTSKPVLEFEQDNILFIDDEYGSDGKVKNGNEMTDGCGFINAVALRKIAVATGTSIPVAIQGRIGGAKGMWLMHPSPEHQKMDVECEDPPKIWIRKSQLKVKHREGVSLDRSLRIFDLVRLPRVNTPASLYMQSILNMNQNGVPHSIFDRILENSVKPVLDTFASWSGPKASICLAKSVADTGRMIGKRLCKVAGSEARLRGYIRDEKGNDEEDMYGEEEEEESIIDRITYSGYPVDAYESTFGLLLAGFSPSDCNFLRQQLRLLLSNVMNPILEKYRIPLSGRSAEAFIVPDPFGVLNEREIYFRSSKEVDDSTQTTDANTFLGEVLVTRNPTKVASDVQKVIAVKCPELQAYKDVIVFSIKGSRSLASYLGGGDYDGDTVTVIAEPEIVNSFKHPQTIDEPSTLREAFEQEIEKVSSFQRRLKELPAQQREQEKLKKIVKSLNNTNDVGLYSRFHDNAVYSLGYNHPETIRLAYMFTTCLDSVKTGLRVKGEVLRADKLKWDRERPESMQDSDEQERVLNRASNGVPLKRKEELGPFILDQLQKRARKIRDEIMIKYEAQGSSSEGNDDVEQPIYLAEKAARECRKANYLVPWTNIERIHEFVNKLFDEFREELGPIYGEARSPSKKAQSLTGEMVNTKTRRIWAIYQKYSERFERGLEDLKANDPNVRRVMASYAYHKSKQYGYSVTRMVFPFVVAYSTLTTIKAEAQGNAFSMNLMGADYMMLAGPLVNSISAHSAAGKQMDD